MNKVARDLKPGDRVIVHYAGAEGIAPPTLTIKRIEPWVKHSHRLLIVFTSSAQPIVMHEQDIIEVVEENHNA